MNEKRFPGRSVEIEPKIDPKLERQLLEDQEANSLDDEFDKYEEYDLETPAEMITELKGYKPAQPDYSKPPKLELADMLNEEGEVVDFSQAKSYHELMEMITREGKIKNQLGQELSAETVINLIYKLTYQDLKNYQREDWTNITLRHKLRETVAKLIYEYKETDEFRALAGLDLSRAITVDEVIGLVEVKKRLIDAQGNYVSSDIVVSNIKANLLHLLPESIRFKIIEINKSENGEHLSKLPEKYKTPIPPVSFFSRLGNTFSKLKFWK